MPTAFQSGCSNLHIFRHHKIFCCSLSSPALSIVTLPSFYLSEFRFLLVKCLLMSFAGFSIGPFVIFLLICRNSLVYSEYYNFINLHVWQISPTLLLAFSISLWFLSMKEDL